MCQDCGCGDVNLVPIEVQSRILARNDGVAAHNRAHLLERRIVAINLMGSPGSGKTALLESTARLFGGKRLAAIAGDLATERDADRLHRAGMRASAIQTGQACHLDAEMIHHQLHHFDLTGVDYLFIENVGNLVCPAVYDLGQNLNVVALSVTEGEDKPLKYPTMFARADLVLLTKIDLIPHLSVDIDLMLKSLYRVMPQPKVLAVSAATRAGLDEWTGWLTKQWADLFDVVLV